jgi:two-component system NarL family sensor kinase
VADDGRTAGWAVAAFALFAVVVAEAAAGSALGAAAGMTPSDLVDAFVVTNLVIGLSCGVAGVLIAWQRPANPVGWLLLGAAVCQSTSGVAVTLGMVGVGDGWPEPVLRTLAALAACAWPLSVAVFLPLALIRFPDGLLPGRLWRAAAWLTLPSGILFTLSSGTGPEPVGPPGRQVQAWFVLPGYADLAPLWTVSELLILLVFGLAAVGLAVRYRRGDEQRRRQLLWLVLAVVAVVVMLVPWGLFGAGPILQLLALALVPAAITIAVLRHQLLDIRLVLSRTLVYALLTAAVLAVYTGLIAVAGGAVGGLGLGGSVLVTLLIAVAFDPLRRRLQRLADRALYGDRADPVRALARMGEQLTGTGELLGAVCEALRLPAAAIVQDGVQTASHGEAERYEPVPLVYQGEQVGELLVGIRRGQRGLDRADRVALEVLAAPLAVAVHATTLSAAVQRSREQIVAAREEERRRLRRDLHDGLGPTLTGISFQADAAGNLIGSDPAAAARLLVALRAAATGAIADVRELVHALRPAALDELGLVEALRRFAAQLGPQVVVHAPAELPELSAAVEVAGYRIAVEALTNAARHAGGPIELRVGVDGALQVQVVDHATGSGPWVPGVGLTSMRERAAELGGTVEVGPRPGTDDPGGRVLARIPLGPVPGRRPAVAEVAR